MTTEHLLFALVAFEHLLLAAAFYRLTVTRGKVSWDVGLSARPETKTTEKFDVRKE